MTDVDKIVVVGAILFLLGAAYVVGVYAFAVEYLLPATVLYLLLALLLVGRILTQKEND